MRTIKIILGSALIGVLLMAIAPKIAVVFGLAVATCLAVAALKDSLKNIALVGGALSIVWVIWFWTNGSEKSVVNPHPRQSVMGSEVTKADRPIVIPGRLAFSGE